MSKSRVTKVKLDKAEVQSQLLRGNGEVLDSYAEEIRKDIEAENSDLEYLTVEEDKSSGKTRDFITLIAKPYGDVDFKEGLIKRAQIEDLDNIKTNIKASARKNRRTEKG